MKSKASLEPSTSEKSVKLEKSDSPASSCVSLKPMDPLANFKEESGHNLRVKQERSESPAPSCVSVRSMNSPLNFKEDITPDSRVKQERSESPAPSCVSVRSMDPPMNFKEEFTPDSSEFITSLLTEDHFRCTVCTDVLIDPVSTPCGHSYCKQCITSYWAQPNHAGHYACPQCPQSYSSHPALYTNSALAEVVQKLQQFSPVLPTHCYAGPEDVACDFCTGRKLRAVKSCLTCTASYCESHVRQHYTVPALQKHRLEEPGHQEQKLQEQCDIKKGDLKQNDQSHEHMVGKDGKHLDQITAVLQNCDLEVRPSWRQRNTMKRKASLETSTSEKSVKMERSDSPASSYVSPKTMDPPANFKEEFGLNLRVKQERSESPAPSCVSVRSKDLPMNFKEEFTPDSRVKQERSESPAPSCVSVRSKDLPMNFKEEFTPDSSEFITSLLTEDQFRCTVCTDVLKDPVSIPCGHSYCKQCITSYWAQPNHAGHYACPQCSQSYSSHPALCTNSALAEVVQKLQQISPVLPTHCYAGPGDVACDFCTGRKLRAVKSCLTCTASYCESHVRQHYTVPALQRHTLVEPTHIGGHQDKTDQWDIKTEDLKQAVPSHLEESLVENGNQRQLLKQQDIHTEDLKLEKAFDRVVTQSQVMTTADLGMPISPRPQTEHQQQQQTTEGPAMQPQQSTQQDLPSSQTDLQEKLCNDNDQNQKEMLEKQDRGVRGNSQDAATVQNSGDARRLSIKLCIESLVHARQCRNAKCSLPSCQTMKLVVQHTKGCKRKTNGGCPICKQFIALCCYHAKHCQENKCIVPFCLNIKHKLRQQQLQNRLKQAQELYRRMALMARTGQMTMPGPQGSSSPSTPIPSAGLNYTLGHQ